MTRSILILPGIGNSGPQHWQTLWEADSSDFQRVNQRDWDHPVCSEWVATLEQAVAAARPETILVAHSLACLMVVHWAASTQLMVSGAMLVAGPNPKGPDFPAEIIGFENLPQIPLPFPSVVIASTNDPYSPLEYAQHCASVWGSRFVNIGAAGHINASSGLGEWAEGRQILATLL